MRTNTQLGLFVLASLLGCGSSNVVAPTAQVPASPVVPPPTVEAPMEVAAAPPDPCAADAVMQFFAEPSGTVSVVEGAPTNTAPAAALAQLDAVFATVRDSRHRVVSAMRLDLGPSNAPFALAITTDAPDAMQGGTLAEADLVLLRCVAGSGFTQVGDEHHLVDGARTFFVSETSFERGGHHVGHTVFVREEYASGASNTSSFFITHPDETISDAFEEPRVPAVVALLGSVESRFVADGSTEYTTVSALDATGWYTLRDDAVYVSFVQKTAPHEGGIGVDVSHGARILATLDASSITPIPIDQHVDPAFFLVGTGIRPGLCLRNTHIRCFDLTRRGEPVPGLRYTWTAGAFSGGEPDLIGTRVPGARWLLLGGDSQTLPRRDPSGRRPMRGTF